MATKAKAKTKGELTADTKQSTSLTEPFKFTRDNIPEKLQQVNEFIQNIQGNLPDKPKTTTALDGFGKIDELKDVSTLIKAHSSVVNREKAYEASYEALKDLLPSNYKKPVFKLNDNTSEQWVDHIKNRIVTVSNEDKLRILTDMKKILEENLSKDQKFENDMAKISKMLA